MTILAITSLIHIYNAFYMLYYTFQLSAHVDPHVNHHVDSNNNNNKWSSRNLEKIKRGSHKGEGVIQIESKFGKIVVDKGCSLEVGSEKACRC
uniref:Uncharacterized protein n=1 Tax=Nelumbo nucifera TaxID=4432 RepID=A0A822Z0M3_NELNU|nr:TPA_asm: hypothetical protein HUJ06_007197 [Nelumbo nucifera]